MSPSRREPLRLDRLLAALLLAAMALIAFANVLGRYLFHYSLAFTEEVTIHLFVAVVLVGSGLAFERGAHLGINGLYRRFPRRMQRGIDVLAAVCAAGLFVVVDLLLLQSIYREWTIFHARSPGLGIPVWIYQAWVVLLSPLVLRGILRGLRSGSPCGDAGAATR